MDARLQSELIDQQRQSVSDPNAELHRRMGVVSAVDRVNALATVTIAGGSTGVPVSYLRDAEPRVNDVVWMIETGGDYLIIGTQATGTGAWTPTVSGGTWALGNATKNGLYQVVGGWCHIMFNIVWGSTSNFGGGSALTVGGLPFAVRNAGPSAVFFGMGITGAGSTQHHFAWKVGGGATSGAMNYSANLGTGSNFFAAVINTAPATFQAGNFFDFVGAYPI